MNKEKKDIELILRGKNLLMKIEQDDLDLWIPVELTEEIHDVDISALVGILRKIDTKIKEFLEEREWIKTCTY